MDHEVARAARRVERAAKKTPNLPGTSNCCRLRSPVSLVENPLRKQLWRQAGFDTMPVSQDENTEVPDIDSVFSNFKED